MYGGSPYTASAIDMRRTLAGGSTLSAQKRNEPRTNAASSGGGGRPDFAQTGGPDAAKLAAAVARVYTIVA